MSKKYYLTTDTGGTFEEMSLEEIGRELLTQDGAKYDINVEYTLVHKEPIGGGDFTRFEEVNDGWLINVTTDIDEAESMLVKKFAMAFIEGGAGEEWLNIPDSVRAYDERGYQEELQWIKENSDA